MRKLIVASSIALAGVFLVGCNEYPQGPAGKVVDNDRTYRGKNLGWKYELVTEKNGKRSGEFRVNSKNYYKCPLGAQYPKCLNKKD